VHPAVTAKKNVYAGLFLVTLATLMYEILLTRIFSVTMWYHFAFVAISIAMFGMTVGAIAVYLLPRYFTLDRVRRHLALSALLFAISAVVCFLVHLRIRFASEFSAAAVWSVALTYLVVSIPFVLSGVCVSLALTRFPRQVSKLYAADLAGAAIGCVAIIYALRITDGPTAVILVAALAALGAALFAGGRDLVRLRGLALVGTVLLAGFGAAHTAQVSKGSPWMRLRWEKGQRKATPLYEKWNSFSRITVTGDPNKPVPPFGWGLSPAFPGGQKFRRLYLEIDANAGTVLTAFDGDVGVVPYLKYDVTNLAHYLRPDSRVLVLGVGGGRDILSALAFNQKSVLGVEMNEDIINVVNRRFGDFTGHLDRNPRVTFVNDEARSYVARQTEQFDIIEASLIDTWAATAAGAFVLAEQSLYTVDAWKVFLAHLTPRGVLTFSRWYFREAPGEIYRLTSLARAALTELGVPDPRRHIIIVRCMARGGRRNAPTGVGTILVSKEPFSASDLDTIEKVAADMEFQVVLSPRYAADPTLAALAASADLDTLEARLPLNVTAPTDDSPFFFHMLRLRDILNRRLWHESAMNFNLKAVFVLGALLLTVTALTFLCIVVPLLLTAKRTTLKGALPLFVFFGSIGFGFMLVEISQMQRLIVFLGHPTYGLSVVLFSLLLSSSLGSYLTARTRDQGLARSGRRRLLLLLGALLIFGLLTPQAIGLYRGSVTPLRIAVATGILFSLGLFMGMAFPLGMKVASGRSAQLTPWLWGINGATSVCASVLAVAIALSSGISASFWTGFACYALAFAAFVWASRPPSP
jgi:hypothetical protein